MKANMIAKLSGLLMFTLAGCVDPAADAGSEAPAIDEQAPEQPEPLEEGAWVTNPVDMPDGRQTLTYQIVNGRAIFGGDVDLGDAAEIARHAHDRGNIRITPSSRWPNAIVPYHIQGGSSNPKAAAIQAAIAQWQQQTLFRFVDHTSEADWVEFVYNPYAQLCGSEQIGRKGGMQTVTLAPGCNKGETMHELGHVVGLWHEHQRQDRDNYIVVDFGNATLPGAFTKISSTDGRDVWPFDFNSIMLYDSYAMARDPSKPVMTKVGTHATWTQNLTALSAYDVKAATLLAIPANATPIHLQISASAKCITAYPDFDAQAVVYPESCVDSWTNEQWYRFPLGNNHYKLINAYTGFCLASWFGSGNPVRQMPCTSGEQLENFTVRTIDTYYQSWKSDVSGSCIDDSGSGIESAVRTVTCNDASAAQKLFAY